MNDVERAIEVLKYYKPKENELIYERDATHKDVEFFDLAISALERQIPKKPNNVINRRKLQDGTYAQTGTCPMCGYDLLDITFNFCKHCGTAIDWKVEE